jgi:hypothetical protein
MLVIRVQLPGCGEGLAGVSRQSDRILKRPLAVSHIVHLRTEGHALHVMEHTVALIDCEGSLDTLKS